MDAGVNDDFQSADPRPSARPWRPCWANSPDGAPLASARRKVRGALPGLETLAQLGKNPPVTGLSTQQHHPEALCLLRRSVTGASSRQGHCISETLNDDDYQGRSSRVSLELGEVSSAARLLIWVQPWRTEGGSNLADAGRRLLTGDLPQRRVPRSSPGPSGT